VSVRTRRAEIALEESVNCHNSQGEQSDGEQNQTIYYSPHKGRRHWQIIDKYRYVEHYKINGCDFTNATTDTNSTYFYLQYFIMFKQSAITYTPNQAVHIYVFPAVTVMYMSKSSHQMYSLLICHFNLIRCCRWWSEIHSTVNDTPFHLVCYLSGEKIYAMK